MVNAMDLWFAWVRGWIDVARSLTAAQHAAYRTLMRSSRPMAEAAAAAHRTVLAAAGDKPAPRRRGRGRKER